MFQDTRAHQSTQQDQDQQGKEQRQKAADATLDVQRRLEREVLTRTYESRAQSIDGKLQEYLARERGGKTVAQVASRVEESVMPGVEFELGRLNPPFNEDRRSAMKADVRRVILELAREKEAERTEALKEAQQAKELALKRADVQNNGARE